MKRIPIRSLITVLALLLALGSAAAEQHRHGDRKGGERGPHHERMAERLELTEAQREKWNELHEAHYPRMRELRREMREQRERLRKAGQDGFDEAAAEQAAGRIGELTAEIALERARMHAQVHEILDEEQRARLQAHHEKRHEGQRHKGQRERRRDHDHDHAGRRGDSG